LQVTMKLVAQHIGGIRQHRCVLSWRHR